MASDCCAWVASFSQLCSIRARRVRKVIPPKWSKGIVLLIWIRFKIFFIIWYPSPVRVFTCVGMMYQIWCFKLEMTKLSEYCDHVRIIWERGSDLNYLEESFLFDWFQKTLFYFNFPFSLLWLAIVQLFWWLYVRIIIFREYQPFSCTIRNTWEWYAVRKDQFHFMWSHTILKFLFAETGISSWDSRVVS